ncbi:NAD(P)(+) transhydrogenase (Re/Si-specific) subunit beta [Dactylosporangium vinaceum]|uniref:NAD(P) transhydrogenase subunit beta n=1 Tax=Dactylosporangium vinaceum TaxID=53362 RepID=A0ABV5MCS7_9ACTN|nr:NAD(P)(+) transhydrogenase (Re/Si-specific) subunit beta [Dactylosporangium vinaceum]UAC00701.1 NAD(P)(+) transhydrogenase (Re/Si-specific) subunit beta [Dactylosporangium vinaceum]
MTAPAMLWAADLTAAVLFVVGLHLTNRPATARRGNRLSALGMVIAVVAAVSDIGQARAITATGTLVLVAGALLGGGAGLVAARRVAMTAMPELVSLFNAVGGGAATVLAIHEFTARGAALGPTAATTGALDVLIGAATFAGSIIAAGKLRGLVPGRPVLLPGRRVGLAGAAVTAVAAGVWLAVRPGSSTGLVVLTVAALAAGVLMVLPIGGADMPVVVSLLNAFTGTAVAMAGLVLGNLILIVAGALVGASGTVLTRLMAAAMNRSVGAIMAGGYGTAGTSTGAAVAAGGAVRSVSPDDVATLLAYAERVVLVPGYGLAAAQAQRQAAELGELLSGRGTAVSYGIHPVAGRMPGHMNVLLAEADVPYPQMLELQPANDELGRADVALVIGANDVTNPAAHRPGNAVSGMPILDVLKARHVVVIKRSMGHGYAGIDNELYTDPRTGMCFTDAKAGLAAIAAALRTLVP